MTNEAPKTSSRKLLLAAGLTGGTTIGTLAVTAVGQFVFSGIPINRLPWYIGAVLLGTVATGWLTDRYKTAIHRREVQALKNELAQVRANAADIQRVLDAVQLVDQQAEVNGVRIQKILDRGITEADTQDIPRAGLRSLPGGGA